MFDLRTIKILLAVFIGCGLFFGGGTIAFLEWGTALGWIGLVAAAIPPAIVGVFALFLVLVGLCWKA